jgi:hypothetical protein
VSKEQAVPTAPFQPEGSIEIVMRISAGLHTDIFHRKNDVTGTSKLGCTSVLVTVSLIENLRHLAMPHEADNGSSRLLSGEIDWYQFEIAKEPLAIDFHVKFFLLILLRFLFLTRLNRDLAFVEVEHLLDKPFPGFRLPGSNRLLVFKLGNMQWPDRSRVALMGMPHDRCRRIRNQSGRKSFDATRCFQVRHTRDKSTKPAAPPNAVRP